MKPQKPENSKTTIHDKSLGTVTNPFAFLEADFYFNKTGKKPTYEEIYHFLQSYGHSSSIELGLHRYLKLRKNITILFCPAHDKFLSRVIYPLRSAMSNYILGEFLGTISICGTVAEMMAVFLFEVWNKCINSNPMSEETQKRIFGSSFEKLGQQRRIEILYENKMINDKTKPCYDEIRNKRRSYLHFYSSDDSKIEEDAFKVFCCTDKIVLEGVGLDFKPKKFLVDETVFEYMKKTTPDYAKWEKIFSNLPKL